MYVPAKFASLRLVDCIFTRLGTNDNLEANSSTVSLNREALSTDSAVQRYMLQGATNFDLLSALGNALSPNVLLWLSLLVSS